MKNFQHCEWIRKFFAFFLIRCGHLVSIKIMTQGTVTYCIFFSFVMCCSCLNRSFTLKNDLSSHITQNGKTDTNQSSIGEKGEVSVVRDHSNGCGSSSHERVLDLKKEGIGNRTHEMSVVRDHSNGCGSSSHERVLDLKKEGIGNRTHQVFDEVDLKKFHQRLKTRLPKYEKIIKQEASKYGLDWALIAAVMYQESHFNPRARSYTGVRGLMQLTLPTARELGVKNRLDPVQSIQGGVKYLKKLWKRFDDVHGPDRILFTLASYNIGYGHVRDAQMLARLQGLEVKRWASIEQCLPLLIEKEYYRQTKYGYARGKEPVQYVKKIITYYDILRKITYG